MSAQQNGRKISRRRHVRHRAASDLDAHPLVKATTAFLQNPNSGRLDVRRIAKLYGEPLAKFASALGVLPSVFRLRPDAERYQNFLGDFERVARILPLLEHKAAFTAWAKTPNKALKGATPLDYLWVGPTRAQEVVDLVEDVLVGQPD